MNNLTNCCCCCCYYFVLKRLIPLRLHRVHHWYVYTILICVPFQASCSGGDCICIPKGICYQPIFSIDFHGMLDLGHHDHDYFITVTVKNNAELRSTRMLKVTKLYYVLQKHLSHFDIFNLLGNVWRVYFLKCLNLFSLK